MRNVVTCFHAKLYGWKITSRSHNKTRLWIQSAWCFSCQKGPIWTRLEPTEKAHILEFYWCKYLQKYSIMATKMIYFTVSGQKEQAEFLHDALTEDIKGINYFNWTEYCIRLVSLEVFSSSLTLKLFLACTLFHGT